MIGAHLPIGKGIWTIQKQMDILKIETCAIFLKNQRRFDFSHIEEKSVSKFKEEVKNPFTIVPHASYLINLANPKMQDQSYNCLIDDMKRCNLLGIGFYNIHPGSDTSKLGNKRALEMIAENLNKAIKEVPNVVVLLENMAGQGNVCGRTFEELKSIIDLIDDQSRIGVTLDTCHMFAGGYDIRSPELFEKIMLDFDRIIGMKYLKAVHLNDSKNEFNSRKDRHESIGKGQIGIEAFRYIMNSKFFEDIPMVLETPEPKNYAKEIEILRGLIQD